MAIDDLLIFSVSPRLTHTESEAVIHCTGYFVQVWNVCWYTQQESLSIASQQQLATALTNAFWSSRSGCLSLSDEGTVLPQEASDNALYRGKTAKGC